MTSAQGPIETLAALLNECGVAYAVIGGHAVNAWLEPRFTADVDVTVAADPAPLARLGAALEREGWRVSREHGAAAPSGPDFVRFERGPDDPPIELQAAKTALQRTRSNFDAW